MEQTLNSIKKYLLSSFNSNNALLLKSAEEVVKEPAEQSFDAEIEYLRKAQIKDQEEY